MISSKTFPIGAAPYPGRLVARVRRRLPIAVGVVFAAGSVAAIPAIIDDARIVLAANALALLGLRPSFFPGPAAAAPAP